MPHPPPPTNPPRPRPAALRVAAALAGAGIALAGLAWFSYVNSGQVAGTGTASYVLAADSGESAGQWHHLRADGSVGDPIGPETTIVPGDRLGFVDTDGVLTDATFGLPAEHGNETQGQQFQVAADGDIFRLEPAPNGTLEFHRGMSWIWVATASALALGGAAFSFAVARDEREASLGAMTDEL